MGRYFYQRVFKFPTLPPGLLSKSKSKFEQDQAMIIYMIKIKDLNLSKWNHIWKIITFQIQIIDIQAQTLREYALILV